MARTKKITTDIDPETEAVAAEDEAPTAEEDEAVATAARERIARDARRAALRERRSAITAELEVIGDELDALAALD